MKKHLIGIAVAAAVALFSTGAAGQTGTSTNPGTGSSNAAGGTGNTITSTTTAASTTTTTETGNNRGNSTDASTGDNRGNTSTSTTNSTTGATPDRITVRNTPDIFLGGAASGPCNGFSGGIGLSVPGFGFGANTSTVDKGCSLRELARVSAVVGRVDIANAALEQAARDLGLTMVGFAPVVVVAPVAPSVTHHYYHHEVEVPVVVTPLPAPAPIIEQPRTPRPPKPSKGDMNDGSIMPVAIITPSAG